MSENSPSCIRFGVRHTCPDVIYTVFSGGVINGTQNRYDEHFGFDKMGNTTSFTRNGLLSSSGGYGVKRYHSFLTSGYFINVCSVKIKEKN